jgi:uncharacterized cupredoxin-like copper-binding protein
MPAVVLLAGLSTGHKIGLLVMAAIFIGFALVSSFVLPRRDPDFPGRYAPLYYIACVALFACMLGAVEFLGAEGQEKTASAAGLAKGGLQKATFDVVETEWRITLPAASAQTLNQGVYVFHVVNKGKLAHNLTVNGPRVANVHTPNIPPGGSADLRVTLSSGRYDLYCSIPGHKQQGMDAKLSVG